MASFETLALTYTRNRMQAPAKDSKQLFLQYAALEETYGLARSAMEVYDRAVRTVVDKERLEVYNLYLARATQFFGVGKVYTSAAEPMLLEVLMCRLPERAWCTAWLLFGLMPKDVVFFICRSYLHFSTPKGGNRVYQL